MKRFTMAVAAIGVLWALGGCGMAGEEAEPPPTNSPRDTPFEIEECEAAIPFFREFAEAVERIEDERVEIAEAIRAAQRLVPARLRLKFGSTHREYTYWLEHGSVNLNLRRQEAADARTAVRTAMLAHLPAGALLPEISAVRDRAAQLSAPADVAACRALLDRISDGNAAEIAWLDWRERRRAAGASEAQIADDGRRFEIRVTELSELYTEAAPKESLTRPTHEAVLNFYVDCIAPPSPDHVCDWDGTPNRARWPS